MSVTDILKVTFSFTTSDPHESSPNTSRHRRPSTTGDSTSHCMSVDMGHPNCTLFSLLLDSLRGMHDREIQLTNDQCDQLIDLITQRDRDLQSHPLPVGHRRARLVSGSEASESVDDSSVSASTSLSGVSVKSLLKTGQSDSVSQSDSSKRHIASRVSPRANVKVQDDHVLSDKSAKVRSRISHDEDSSSANRWHCFVKCVNGSHMIFSFIPSSYGDLCSLSEAHDGSLNDSVEKNDSVTFGTVSSVSRGEGDVTGDDRVGDIDTATSAVCSCPSIASGHVSVPLPLYVYNCPMNILSEQLVNRWTYTRSPDIYEDLTFKVCVQCSMYIQLYSILKSMIPFRV